MAWAPVFIGGIFVSALVIFLLNFYGNRKTCPWYVQIVAFVSWLGPFCVPFLLPLDISSTLYAKCREGECDDTRVPFAYVSEDILHAAWSGIYWTSFVLTWGLIPIMQSYVDSGGFEFWPKFKGAVKENLIFYLVLGVLGGAALVYIAVMKNLTESASLTAFVMAMANCWGLILIVGFMGYGLVDVPKGLWQNANTHLTMRQLEFKAPSLKEKLVEAETDLYDVASELKLASSRVKPFDPLRLTVDRLLDKCPLARGESNKIPAGYTGAAQPPDDITKKYLADLHLKIKRAYMNMDRAECIWKSMCNHAYFLQDVIESKNKSDRKFDRPLSPLPPGRFREFRLSAEWWWYIHLRPFVMRILAVLCALMSVSIVWSELTFMMTQPVISIVGIFFRNVMVTYGQMEAVALITVSYMCICAYSSLMKLRFFNYYMLVPHHHTDPNSLLFIGAYLCRLTIPLCFNFINLTTSQVDAVFSEIMGKMDVVAFLGDEFSNYIPIAILIPVILTLTNAYNRILSICHVTQYFTDDMEKNGLDFDEGRQLIEDERSREEKRSNVTSNRPSGRNGRRAVVPPRKYTRGGRSTVVAPDVSEDDQTGLMQDMSLDNLSSGPKTKQSEAVKETQPKSRFPNLAGLFRNGTPEQTVEPATKVGRAPPVESSRKSKYSEQEPTELQSMFRSSNPSRDGNQFGRSSKNSESDGTPVKVFGRSGGGGVSEKPEGGKKQRPNMNSMFDDI